MTYVLNEEQLKRWQKLCDDVIAHAQGSTAGSFIQYAASYAKKGKPMIRKDEIFEQSLYITTNLANSHGPKAKDLKERLRVIRRELDA